MCCEPVDGHAAAGDVDLWRPRGPVRPALRPRRPRPDDVDRHADGLHARRRQRPSTALPTRTGRRAVGKVTVGLFVDQRRLTFWHNIHNKIPITLY